MAWIWGGGESGSGKAAQLGKKWRRQHSKLLKWGRPKKKKNKRNMPHEIRHETEIKKTFIYYERKYILKPLAEMEYVSKFQNL